MSATPDAVTVSLVQNRLDYISRRMGWVMTRTARSPIFSQAHDFSCFLTDGAGTLVSSADGIPIHTGGGGFAARAAIAAFGAEMVEGDVFVLNDPYVAGGNHLPDWVVARPVFVDDRCVAMTCNRAHQSDIGGGVAGTYNPRATEIFHEGLRLPPLRLIEAGARREDLWQLLLINSRTPELLDGDLRAMVGSTRIGAELVERLFAELGGELAAAAIGGVLDRGEAATRAAIAELPDGRYEATELTRGDAAEDGGYDDSLEIPIRVAVTIAGDSIEIDFEGSAPQMRGFKNSSQANTASAVYMALASFLDPRLPRNEGSYRAVSIVAPEGSVVNPRYPAPVTMCTVFIAHEIVHAIWRALARVDPRRACAGWGKSISGVTAGDGGPRLGEQPFVMYHWNALPGAGAVEGRDGFNQIGHLITLGGLTLPNVEAFEQMYPMCFRKQEFRVDGGGAGRWRGGTGVDYEVEVEAAATYSFRGEGLLGGGGFGIGGGQEGVDGEMTLVEDGESRAAPRYDVLSAPPLTLRASSPGGGGWGDPLDRDPVAVVRDVRDGVVSERAASRLYGVIIDDVGDLDETATRELRERRGESALGR